MCGVKIENMLVPRTQKYELYSAKIIEKYVFFVRCAGYIEKKNFFLDAPHTTHTPHIYVKQQYVDNSFCAGYTTPCPAHPAHGRCS